MTDPADLIFLDLVYDGLTTFDAGVDTQGAGGVMPERAVPDLASSLQVSPDGLTWTVSLEEAMLSDGSPVDSADVKSSLERVAAGGESSLAAARLEIVDGYREFVEGRSKGMSGLRLVDEMTLEIRLSHPYPRLPELLASPVYGIVPEETSISPRGVPRAESVTSGPYRITGVDSSVTHLDRVSPRTSGESSTGDRPRKIPESVEVISFHSWEEAFREFQTGGLDWTLAPSSAAQGVVGAGQGSRFVPLGTTLWFGLDTDHPSLRDERMRRALVHAVDGQAVVDDALSGWLPLRSLLPVGLAGFDRDACSDLCEPNKSLSRRLVREVFPGGPPTIPIDVYDSPIQAAVARSVAEQLEEVGIATETRARPLADFLGFVAEGQPALFGFGTVGVGAFEDLYLGPPFFSKSIENVVGLESARVDQGLEALERESDEAARRRLVRDAQRRILATGVVLPLAQLQSTQVLSERVERWETRIDGSVVISKMRLAG